MIVLLFGKSWINTSRVNCLANLFSQIPSRPRRTLNDSFSFNALAVLAVRLEGYLVCGKPAAIVPKGCLLGDPAGCTDLGKGGWWNTKN